MEKGDWRKDKKSNENLNSSKGKGNSKIPTAEPSKWAKYHQGWIYDFTLYIFTYFLSYCRSIQTASDEPTKTETSASSARYG